MRYMVRSSLRIGLLSLLTAGLGGADLLAQTAKPGEPEVLSRDARRSNSRFRMFGDRDFAVAGLRLAGTWSGCTENSGNFTTPDQCWNEPSPLFMPNWFDIFFYWAAPPSEWTKHTAEVPSLANARGKGYTVNSALTQFSGEILPHDGTLGPLHAGAQSTDDGSCLDNQGSFIDPGNPLLAMSDCPQTWGSAGWQGTRFVDQDGFLAYAALIGDADFTFDTWRVPDELRRNDKFLGNVQTFGYFSDYSSEALFGSSVYQSYGNVIPEAMGGNPAQNPGRTGWPLGLLAKQDAFSFAAPGLLNTAWYQFTVTNNSREVYGVALDYDSLYMGLQPGWLTYEQGTSNYRDPANGVVRGATFCQTPTCGPGGDPQHPGNQWGSIPPNGVGTGFNYGAAAIIVLKSPIGDLRNKKFTDSSDPFFMKGDPQTWDDTITFNHGHMCGFHGCSAVVWNASVTRPPLTNTDYEQRQFGMVASITPDVIGDRTVGNIAQHTMWDTWRWEEYPNVGALDFNRWTPGGWDYDDDGADDELAYDDCSGKAGPQFDPVTGHSKNCSVSWSDTLPGGFGNVYSNRGAIAGAGPFSLPADSTVEWVVALVHATDSVSIENDINKAIDHYMAFYLGPEPPPSPTITSAEVNPGGTTAGAQGQPEASVTLYFDATTEDWEDPFLTKFLNDMLAADPASELGQIRDLNPFLEDTLRTLIPNNVAALHIFKSCDGGGGFTNDADCFDDPATGGTFGSLGWLPWRTLEPNASGDFPNSVTDDGIFGGRSFLYSIIAESRGLEVSVRTGVPGAIDVVLQSLDELVGNGDGVVSTFTGSLANVPVVPTTLTITDGTQTVTDDGNGHFTGDLDAGATDTIDYVTGDFEFTFAAPPADGVSVLASYDYNFTTCVEDCGSQTLAVAPGLVPAIATATNAPGVVSVYVPVSQQSGSNRATVELVTASPDEIPFDRMNIRPTRDEVVEGEYQLLFADQVTVTETATVSALGVEITDVTVELTDTDDGTVALSSPTAVAVEGEFSDTIVGDQRTRTWVLDGLTAVLAEADGTPLMVTTDLSGGQTVPGRFFGLENFPGITMSIDNSVGGSFNEQFYLDADGEQVAPLVEPAVTFLSGLAEGVATEGRYRLTWTAQPFGSGSPFQLNLGNPSAAEETFISSLEGRTAGQTASVDPDVASFLGLPVEQLLAVRLPFVIENITDPDGATPVIVVVPTANKQTSATLGIGDQSLEVEVPETEWVPGDELMLMEGSAPDFRVTFGTAVFGCDPNTWRRVSCNPVTLNSPGATGYIPAMPDQELHFEYFQTITAATEYTFAVSSAIRGPMVNDRAAIRAALDSVKVVPNPYVLFSQYAVEAPTSEQDRIIFTHVPPQGVLRIFTIAGQFVQQIRWQPDDLNGRGDLWFNLRTREGNLMAAGLYLFVLEAQDENGSEIGTAKGKFVVIR